MHAVSPRAFAGTLGRARWRTVGAAIAAGIAGPALFVIPALAQTGNQAPAANDDTYAVVLNMATPLTVLGNDTDPEGDTLGIQSVSVPAHGLAALTAGTLTYTPTAAYLGVDSFTYTITDGHGNFDTATVHIVVSATVGVPVAQDDSVTVPMNTATPINVLANDTDPDGQALTIATVSTPAHGTAAIVGGTSITYTPTAGYSGADTFSYTVSDGAGSSDLATVTVNVTGTGNAPVVQNDTANVLLNTSTVLNILANDSDPNGDPLTITSVSTPGHGTATIAGDAKSVTYVPATGYTSADAFTYTVSDGHGNSAPGAVAVTVAAQNALLARNDTASTKVDTAKTIAVLRNDVASNSAHALTVTSVSTPVHGTATIAGDARAVTYTPAAGYTGTDTFVYVVTEAGGGSATATVTVTIRPASTGDDDDDHDRDDCKEGRWIHLGFRNQGLCIAAGNHGGHGMFPGGLFPRGIFGDCDDDRDGDRTNRLQSNTSAKHSDDDDRWEKQSDKSDQSNLGTKIRESVKASIANHSDHQGGQRDAQSKGRGR